MECLKCKNEMTYTKEDTWWCKNCNEIQYNEDDTFNGTKKKIYKLMYHNTWFVCYKEIEKRRKLIDDLKYLVMELENNINK